MAQLIDGKVISAQIKDEVKEKVAGLKEQGCEVTLAVIQVGSDPSSSVYVRNKKKACEYVGIRSLAYELPEETTEKKLLELIRELNDRTDVNGILVTKRADILVVAVGKPKMITAEYVKEGAVVIDVGIHRNEENKLCGDVDFDSVEPVCSAITPVPGGVGPMTIAMLMNNCLESVSLQAVRG